MYNIIALTLLSILAFICIFCLVRLLIKKTGVKYIDGGKYDSFVFTMSSMLLLMGYVYFFRGIIDESSNCTQIAMQSKIDKVDRTELLIESIIEVESGGDSTARSASSTATGPMQILNILVRDANRINKNAQKPIKDENGNVKQWTYNSRFSKAESKEMFMTVQKYYNPTLDIEKAIRLWNGGVGYTNAATDAYYNKVIKVYNSKIDEQISQITSEIATQIYDKLMSQTLQE